MRALLDSNVLIALLDADHLMHAAARRWLVRELDVGWASCPVTQNGVLRILSQPSLLEGRRHLIGPAGVNWRQLLGHRQVTDAYLLAVAVAEGGRLVSFDQRISVDLVPEARADQLVVIESESR